MFKKKYLLFFSLFILGVLLITSCLLKPPATEGILKGQVMVPEGSKQTKELTGQALSDATVNIIDLSTGYIIATTTTDANGYYQVFVLTGGPYLLEAVKDGIKVQQFTPQVEAGIEYDLGTADCATTAVALIAQAMMDAEDYPDNPADINLADIEADPDFNEVMSIVCGIIEAGEDPTESALVQQVIEDFLYPPTPTPNPTPTPVAVSAIIVTGEAKVGVELTAVLTPPGATASYQWQICATSGGTYTNITGATANKYTPVAGDATKFIKVVATGTGNYSGTATSDPTTAVAAATLSSVAITTPASKLSYSIGDALDITGLVVTGTYSDTTTKVETITTGNITGFNSSAPAVDQVLTITVGDKTTTYTVTIVAIPITAIGAITGTAQVDVELTVGALTPAGATATYQWRISSDGTTYADISGATTKTYTPVAGDATKFIKVVATGTGNYSGTATSDPTAAVAAATPVIATASTIANGAAAPTVTVTGINFKALIAAADLTVGVGTTGLTLGTVSFVSATEITVAFAGTAAAGDVTIQAKTSAFDPAGVSASNTLTITVPEPAVINIAAIPGVTAPVIGATPVTTITATVQYTGTVAWAPADDPFLGSQAYTATITLTAKTGFTLTGVALDFFAVAGATATNPINSGVVTAVFPATLLVVGASYGGGKVAYILQSGDTGYDANKQHGLIAATADQSTGIAWSNITGTLVGTTGTAIGTGQTNTTAIVGQAGCASGAAKLCDDLTLNTYSDWYLPSKDELNKLYLNQVAIGGFANAAYWSSSETSATKAWNQNFNNGNQNNNNKNNSRRVRAVRAF